MRARFRCCGLGVASLSAAPHQFHDRGAQHRRRGRGANAGIIFCPMQIPTIDGEPILSGVLWLQPQKSAWHRRHAVLRANLLFWYAADADAKPLGCLCIEGLRVQPLEPPPE